LIAAKDLDLEKTTTTRLGRAVRASFNDSWERPTIGKEKHSTNNSLRDVIPGGQDGLVKGVYSARTLVGDWRKSGLQMLAIGLGAAALRFFIGRLFHTMGG
jgi:VIT1/CCC1 family predicted Fe2+/Mn2+ transporter